MPYKTVWEKPEELMSYKGLTIYHVYNDNNIDSGELEYWFTTNPDADGEDFDIRDLKAVKKAGLDPNIDDSCECLRAAIDAGEIQPYGN